MCRKILRKGSLFSNFSHFHMCSKLNSSAVVQLPKLFYIFPVYIYTYILSIYMCVYKYAGSVYIYRYMYKCITRFLYIFAYMLVSLCVQWNFFCLSDNVQGSLWNVSCLHFHPLAVSSPQSWWNASSQWDSRQQPQYSWASLSWAWLFSH